ncbi:MAG: hypothetical protein HYY16_01540 [Planctomycetes bacterium]|nr:hypothetical protein [Planctomycetota bacterium]
MIPECLALGVMLGAGGIPQDDRDEPVPELPAEIRRCYRLAHWSRAEELLQEALKREASDALRYGLINVLYRARRYEECMRECERLAGTKDAEMSAFALALKGACAWKTGDVTGARTWCAQAKEAADRKAPNAFPVARRWARITLAFLSWERHESPRFLLFHPPDPAGRAGAPAVAARLEALWDATAALFGPLPEDRIEVYLFHDQRHADEILGVPLPFAVPRDRAIYALRDGAPGHALGHILSFAAAAAQGKERPKSAFLNEGLACALSEDELWERRMKEVPRLLLQEEKLRPLSELMKTDGIDGGLAAAGGAFIRWLLESQGKAKFVKLWVEYNDHAAPWEFLGLRTGYKDDAAPWKVVYGCAPDELDAAWRTSLRER